MTKKLDLDAIDSVVGTMYPPPYDKPCRARSRKKLGDAAGLSQFGLNLVTLPPGAWSSQRHYHAKGDEFIYIVEGELTLVTDQGEETFGPGDCAGFPAGEKNAHHLQNRSPAPARYIEIGTRLAEDSAHYPGIDLVAPPHGKPAFYTHNDGTPYTDIKRRGPDDEP